MKTSLGNIVWNSKMHPHAQYEIIWTKYAIPKCILVQKTQEKQIEKHNYISLKKYLMCSTCAMIVNYKIDVLQIRNKYLLGSL